MKTAFDKMKERMGVAAAEALRLDTIKLQREAQAAASASALKAKRSEDQGR